MISLAMSIYSGINRLAFSSDIGYLTVFIFHGIGCNNFILYFNSWSYAGKTTHDLRLRLAYTFKRALKRIILNNVLYLVAFLVLCFSQFVPINNFGILALINLVLSITTAIILYPATLITNESLIKPRCTLCSKFCCKFTSKASKKEMSIRQYLMKSLLDTYRFFIFNCRKLIVIICNIFGFVSILLAVAFATMTYVETNPSINFLESDLIQASE